MNIKRKKAVTALSGILACLVICACTSEESFWTPSSDVQAEGVYFPPGGGTDAYAVVSGNTICFAASDKLLGEEYDSLDNELQKNHPDKEELRRVWIDDIKTKWAEPREFFIYDIGENGKKETILTLNRTYDEQGRIISSSGLDYIGEDIVNCCGIEMQLDSSGRLPCKGSEYFTLEAYCESSENGYRVTARVGNRCEIPLVTELYGDFFVHGKGEEFGAASPGYYYENVTFEPGEVKEFSFEAVKISEDMGEINGSIVIQLTEQPEGEVIPSGEGYQRLTAAPVDLGLVLRQADGSAAGEMSPVN